LQRAASEPDQVAAFQERVGFCFEGTPNHSSDRLNFRRRDHGPLPSESQDTVNPRSGQDWLPAFERAAEENIAREEGKGKLLISIFPTVDSGVKRKEGLESFVG